MADAHHNALLNDLLIDLARCLLQYVGECWPWMAEDEAEQGAIDELVGRQQQGVARLAELLNGRRYAIDFGAYPTDYTDLHYLALDHLLGQLVASHEALIGVIGRAQQECAGDAEGVSLIEQIGADERENLSWLQQLAGKSPAVNPA